MFAPLSNMHVLIAVTMKYICVVTVGAASVNKYHGYDKLTYTALNSSILVYTAINAMTILLTTW